MGSIRRLSPRASTWVWKLAQSSASALTPSPAVLVVEIDMFFEEAQVAA
jgi:hypothetical protein